MSRPAVEVCQRPPTPVAVSAGLGHQCARALEHSTAGRTPIRGAPGRAEQLTLRVLRRLAGLLQTVLLPLLDPRVTGQEAGLLQGRTVLGLVVAQRPGDGQA